MGAITAVSPRPRSASGLSASFRRVALPSRFVAISASTLAALLAAQVVLVLLRLGGHFVYTLDDPYIHLALAAQIARGHYGLFPDAASAPSSSILYPFLLAPLQSVGFGGWAPMLVNAAAAAASAWVLAALIERSFPGTARLPAASIVVLAALSDLGLNLVGVAMTGMEHSLHVALTLVWLLGASEFLRRGRVARWWWLAAALGPFVRYEGVALWLATVVLLAASRSRRAALQLLIAVGGGLATFSLFLHALGLAWLPSSVLVKAAQTDAGTALDGAGPLLRLAATLLDNAASDQGALLLLAELALALVLARKWGRHDPESREARVLCLVGLWVSSAQLAAGRVDGFSRYAVYALALDAAIVLTGAAPELRAFAARRSRGAVVATAAAGAALLLPLASLNIHRSLRADAASSNIFEQQYQMHRLAADFVRAPVAVNDLGLVSFENPYPVQDLWGLGSEEARIARSSDPSGRWMGDFVDRHGVGTAMIYARWFHRVPERWVLRGVLHLGSALESAGGSAVSIYATGPERAEAVDAALDAWEAGLPRGVRLSRPPARGPIDATDRATGRSAAP